MSQFLPQALTPNDSDIYTDKRVNVKFPIFWENIKYKVKVDGEVKEVRLFEELPLDSSNGLDGWLMPPSSMITRVIKKSKLVKTPINGGGSVVIESFGYDVTSVTIVGTMVNSKEFNKPEDQLRYLNLIERAMTATSFVIGAEQLEWKGIYRLAIETLETIDKPGELHSTDFVIKGIADIPVELRTIPEGI